MGIVFIYGLIEADKLQPRLFHGRHMHFIKHQLTPAMMLGRLNPYDGTIRTHPLLPYNCRMVRTTAGKPAC